MNEQQTVDLAQGAVMILTSSQPAFTLVNGPSAVHVQIRVGADHDAVWLDGQLAGNRDAAARHYARLVWRAYEKGHGTALAFVQDVLGRPSAPAGVPIAIAPSWSGWRFWAHVGLYGLICGVAGAAVWIVQRLGCYLVLGR